MKRCALILAVFAASCTKPTVGQSADAVPVRAAAVEGATSRGAATSPMPTTESRFAEASRPSSSWSVGVKREAEQASDASDEVGNGRVTGDDTGGYDRATDRTREVQAIEPQAAAKATGSVEVETKLATQGSASTSQASAWRPPAEASSSDAGDDDDENASEQSGVESEPGASDCELGEVPEGYDAAGDDTGVCVPRKLVETCRKLGQLPVIVSDMGMDCFVPQGHSRLGDDDLEATPPIDLPSCEADAAIVLLPEIEGTSASAFDCRQIAQLDEATASALSQQACGDEAAVIRIYADSSTEESIRGDVSCL